MFLVSIDKVGYNKKPENEEIGKISKRIAKNKATVSNLKGLAEIISIKGHTWCPAVFNCLRRIDDFESIQFIALDFDGGVSFDEICNRAKKYMLPILFAYETFSSVNMNKFRIVFVLENPITDVNAFKLVMAMFMKIFSECDPACKDVARMFFGGKSLIYYNSYESKVNADNLKMNFELYMKNEHGNKHYKDRLRTFYKNINGESSPNPKSYKSGNGEKSPIHKNHRSDILKDLEKSCRLYYEFTSDNEWLYYKDLFGIATNLIHAEAGIKHFLKCIDESQYTTYKRDWKFYTKYLKDNSYQPMNCDNFCPYAENCPHKANMLLTAKIKRKDILRIKTPEYVSVSEAYSELEKNFITALEAEDTNIHLIKAQTAIGKTRLYINYLQSTNKPCIIAVPTNMLKHEVYQRCIDAGVDAFMTPSIEDIRNKIPEKVYNHIQKLYESGNHRQVTSYILKVLKSEAVPALKQFLDNKKY